MPFFVYYIKLVEVTDSEPTAEQEERFERHARRNRSLSALGNLLFWGGGAVTLGSFSMSSVGIGETVCALGAASCLTGLLMLVLERCPFCGEITLHPLYKRGYRCINCHRPVDADGE